KHRRPDRLDHDPSILFAYIDRLIDLERCGRHDRCGNPHRSAVSPLLDLYLHHTISCIDIHDTYALNTALSSPAFYRTPGAPGARGGKQKTPDSNLMILRTRRAPAAPFSC